MQRIVADKANTFAARGYDVSILCTNADEQPVIYKLSPSVKYCEIQPLKGLSYFFSYRKLLKKHINAIRPDIIIMCDNGLKSFLLPYIAPKKYKLVYEMHGSKYIWDATVKSPLLRKCMYRFMDYSGAAFDSFVVLTESARKEWPQQNITVLPNYVWFEADVQSALTAKIAITVGRHVPEKGYDRLLAAWKIVSVKYPDWQLHIYGDDNIDYNVKQIAAGLAVESSVQFVKPVKNIQEAYKFSSICLMASRYEGFGMALVEAMACGVPCVAFDCPVGPRDIIDDGKNGFLVKDDDITAFANAIIRLIEDDKLREVMGNNAVVSTKKYSKDILIARWERLFKSLS